MTKWWHVTAHSTGYKCNVIRRSAVPRWTKTLIEPVLVYGVDKYHT